MDFALRVVRMFSQLPKSTEAQVLGKQLLRSGTSIGANYREAFRGRSKAEFVAKCGDCLREVEESAYWLELLVAAGIVLPRKARKACAKNATNSPPSLSQFLSARKASDCFLLNSSFVLLPFYFLLPPSLEYSH